MAIASLCAEAITCLVDNAIEYTPPLSDIEIEVHEIDHEACVSVMDRGPGFTVDIAQLSGFDTSKKDPSCRAGSRNY